MLSARLSKPKKHFRRGATLVIELARLFTIQNTVENAAMEGARRGIIPGASVSSAQQSAREVLTAVRISNSTITVIPSVITSKTPTVTLTVSAPVAGNTWIPSRFFTGTSLSKTITMAREMAP
jgi:hypothetical protein